MKNLIRYTIAVALVMSAWACDDFGDLNESPNSPIKVPVSGLLTNGIHRLPDIEVDDLNTGLTEGLYYENGVFYAQYFSSKQYSGESRYTTSQFDFTRMYASGLNDLEEVIRLNSDPETMEFAAQSGSNANQIAVASILKAYYIMHATDRWGDLPVSQALQGLDNMAPEYDSQQDIYNNMFQLLKDAVSMMDSGATPKGDIIYGGDLSKWEAFANSLRLRMALRLSKVDPTLAESEFVSAVNDGVFTSIDDNAIYHFLGDGVFDNIWWQEFETRIDYAVSETIVDYMSPLNDPRLPAYADPNQDGDYVGMPYGIPEGEAGSIPAETVSLPNSDNVRAIDSPVTILSYSQVLFALAEGAQLNWIGGSAEDYYEQGIQASFEEWGVFDQTTYDTYIAQPGVAFVDADAIQLISEQRWLALYLNGYEGWAEWRRTGFPALAPAPAALNNSGEIPRRQAYPLSESLNNSANYEAAIARQGPDILDTRVWWDVE